MYKANITVTLRPSILDPQGKVTQHALESIGFAGVERVRMGKFIEMWVEAETEEEALNIARESCRRVLANPVMEDFRVELEKAVTSDEGRV